MPTDATDKPTVERIVRALLAGDIRNLLRPRSVPTSAISTVNPDGSTSSAGEVLTIDSQGFASWDAASGGLTLTQVEVDLGSAPRMSGSFTITSSGLTVGKPVLVTQAKAAYTGKGILTDEPEMDQIACSGVVTSATDIAVSWVASGPVKGNVKFDYIVGA